MWTEIKWIHLWTWILPPLAPEMDTSTDSTEMVKAIIQTVQNQDKVLKDLYTHLRWDPHSAVGFGVSHSSADVPLVLFPSHSKILISKQKIIDLFPRIEKTLENIKDADTTVMQMQTKRQREFWHLLKIACVSEPMFLIHTHTQKKSWSSSRFRLVSIRLEAAV